ncbi:MAG TPA: hypothetical protein VKZ50_06030 [bacterium]|nr:hypothetical protein [bacterium]
MALHPACHVVEDYLAAMFPRSVIEEFEWSAQRSWVFKVSVPRKTFHLLVSTKLLDQTNEHEIDRLLRELQVASRMRLADREWPLLTAEGVVLGLPKPA